MRRGVRMFYLYSAMDAQCGDASDLNGPEKYFSNSTVESRRPSGSIERGQEETSDVFGDLLELPVEITERRPTCVRCGRPQKVCLCPFLPARPLEVSTCLYIVQHPAEESRALRTVPLLAASLPPGKCKVLVGRRFSEERNPELAAVCRDPHTLVLYPGLDAENLEDMEKEPSTSAHNIIIIDGTWSQARDMFLRNALFRLPKQVQLRNTLSSQYVIRTQPTNMCLSTLECAAAALSIVERRPAIQEQLLRPLQALCTFQLQHGAQVHHSKEQLLRTGRNVSCLDLTPSPTKWAAKQK
uniref:tRNA-uridine aminocarboxypropyltransferase n=1 Tax=Paramormyrops kingsleyae TaxID=1676925 RepID=A0A3B3QM80_9TELE